MLDWPAFDQHFFGLAQDYRAKFLLGKLVRKRNPSRRKAQVDGNGLEGKPITDADDPASITARSMGVKNSLTTAFQRGMGDTRMMKARDIPARLGSEDICKIGR